MAIVKSPHHWLSSLSDKKFKISTSEMEIALAKYFNYRANLIVPNISWGMDVHECDLLMMSKKGYFTEIEIKISKSDLKKDIKKWHMHDGGALIRYFYFAIPSFLFRDAEAMNLIPERAGIIVVDKRLSSNGYDVPYAMYFRASKINFKAEHVTLKRQYEFARLGSLRIWSLKEKIEQLKKRK